MQSIKYRLFLNMFIIVFSFVPIESKAQITIVNSAYDTLEIKAGYILKTNDTILNINSDTIIILQSGTKYKIKEHSELKSERFYNNLKEKSNQKWLYNELYNTLIVEEKDTVKKNTGNFVKSDVAFIPFEGKIIGNIRFKHLDLFGGSVNDSSLQTTSMVLKSLEKTHINTKNYVLRKNLLFKSGQKIDAVIFADTERKLRSLAYISDAKIIINVRENNPEIADILIFTKDNYSIGLTGGLGSFDAWNIGVKDKNFMGMGYELSFTLFYDNFYNQNYGYNSYYVIDNIASTFIRSEFNYLNTATRKHTFIDFSRGFISSTTKYGGGLRFGQINDNWHYYYQDSIFEIPYKRNFGDLWIGKAINIDNNGKNNSVVISGRFFSQNYINRGIVNVDTNQFLHSKQLVLASLSYRNIDYYKTSMLLDYGITEDVPEGLLLQATGGVEFGEFTKRNYLALRVGGSFILQSDAFFAVSANFGFFLRNYKAEEALAKIKLKYFTKLFNYGAYKFRQIVEFSYTGGYNQLYYKNFSFSNEIFGLSSDSPRGIKKISLNLQTVYFLPINLFRFKFTAYNFIDIGFISPDTDIYKRDNFYAAFGLGLRISNKNLVFGALNISFSLYPRVNNGASHYYLNFEADESKLFHEIDIAKPDILRFE